MQFQLNPENDLAKTQSHLANRKGVLIEEIINDCLEYSEIAVYNAYEQAARDILIQMGWIVEERIVGRGERIQLWIPPSEQ